MLCVLQETCSVNLSPKFRESTVNLLKAKDIIYKFTSIFERVVVLCVVQKTPTANLHPNLRDPTIYFQKGKRDNLQIY